MDSIKGYLFDLDGTLYAGTEPIKAAVDFVNRLEATGFPYLFVTNNASMTPAQVADKLVRMGVHVTPEHVLTSAMATARYIEKMTPGATIYMIGEDGLRIALEERGFTITDEPKADYVVIGLDRHITYEKLAKGALAIRGGARFISTNGDIAIPTERGFLPGNGALTSVLAVTTEKDPFFIGKPEPVMVDIALEMIGLSKEEVVMVGDNYHTDILFGINGGIQTLHVNSGVHGPAFIQAQEKLPTYMVESLDEWIHEKKG
ncbi:MULTISPECIES: TIGR01457 family HAD-type hydrolase [Exiguobacterium]|uniref:TIGR01457 family HAD-type hydrolase n=1 Tax=Exiguobacterium TaxID=33986 RepID=UPI001BE61DA1|nr:MULTISPECIES: TIGR01457 family HAD-type hydrolase [Exiguobacterium]MCT4784092.1 TIGR01457 family HAD-type hydrolase [Exiguobacterium himgiriensis]